MPQSETVGKLMDALVKAQSEFVTVPKSKTGQEGNRSFKYADLADVVSMVTPRLNKVGVFLSQPIILDEQGNSRQATRLQLGTEFIQTDGIKLADNVPGKTLGISVTYARRIDLNGLLGISPDDDLDAPDLKAAPTFAKPVNTPAQVAKTVSSKSTSFEYGANRTNPEITDSDIPDFNTPLETEKPLPPEVAAIADHLLHFVPLTAERNTQIQARLKELVSAKTLDRRKLGLFLDARHEGKKAFDVPASTWEDTILRIESAVSEGDAAIKTLFKRD